MKKYKAEYIKWDRKDGYREGTIGNKLVARIFYKEMYYTCEVYYLVNCTKSFYDSEFKAEQYAQEIYDDIVNFLISKYI